MKALPRSPAELVRALASIFPSLPRGFGTTGESSFDNAGPTFHSVLREFSYFFARNLQELPDRQLRRFADLLTQAQAQGGELADAMSAWLQEQAHDPRVQQRLAPFLGEAKK